MFLLNCLFITCGTQVLQKSQLHPLLNMSPPSKTKSKGSVFKLVSITEQPLYLSEKFPLIT